MTNCNCVAAFAFHFVEREIGVVEKLLRRRIRLVQAAYSDAERHLDLQCRDEVSTNAFGKEHGVGGLSIRQEHCELVTSQAAGQVERTRVCPQKGSDGREHVVSDNMPVGVVDRLESIHIDHHQAKWMVVAQGPRDLFFDALAKHPPDSASCQLISCSEIGNLRQ